MELDKLIKALEKNRYQVTCFERGEEAAEYLDREIRGKTVGLGDSATLMSLGIAKRLEKHNKLYDPQRAKDSKDFLEIAEKCLITDVFLTSVNAVSETGELVNIDGTGNRVAGSLYRHDKVYFVVGINKIQPTLEKAVHRARNIAAPANAKRWGYKTPCAVKGDKCYDCNSPERICNAMVIHLKKMNDCDAEVVLIKEDLGY